MKTKLTLLLLTAVALSGAAYAGPSDAAAFAIRHAREAARANPTVTVADNSGNVTYVPSSSGKGGDVVKKNDGSTNIALFKSKKGSSECSACCKADAKKR